MFNEDTLREEIIKVWGPAGAHIDVYDMLLQRLRAYEGGGVTTSITDALKARIVEGTDVNEPGYVVINDQLRLDGHLLMDSMGLTFRMDVDEPFVIYPRSTIKMYFADGTPLYTGPIVEYVAAQAGNELTFTAPIRIVE